MVLKLSGYVIFNQFRPNLMFASKFKGQQCIRMTITRLTHLMVDNFLNLTSFCLYKHFNKNLESLKSQNRYSKTDL
jgi:hypothetical protein